MKLDLSNVKGSGPKGRIVKQDIAAVQSPVAEATARISELYSIKPHSVMRKVIAKRLLESKQSVPHFYLTVDCNLDALLKTRQHLNENTKDYKISVNDLIIKASSSALKQHPGVNASWQEDAIIFYNNIDISVAVAIEDGLITPIIKNADCKDLVAISHEMKSLIAKAINGRLKPEEFQGGGFSISNLGMYGIKQFNAIINPPQACILAVGGAEDRATVKDGQLAVAKMMTLSLSCDHRVIDGALAAKFLGTIKQMIECPMLMLI
jgi:pyruvate dehydrogenase E2 component (dihydrolipoamide acetyltransferase)